MSSDGEHYVPIIPEDKFSFFGSETDELVGLGSGFPIYFALIRRIGIYMFFFSCFFALALCIQGNIFYEKLIEVEDEHMAEEVAELSDFARVSAYSVTTFRLVYGFDYGQWAIDAYLVLIMVGLLLTFAFSTFLSASLKQKAIDLMNGKRSKLITAANFTLHLQNIKLKVDSKK